LSTLKPSNSQALKHSNPETFKTSKAPILTAYSCTLDPKTIKHKYLKQGHIKSPKPDHLAANSLVYLKTITSKDETLKTEELVNPQTSKPSNSQTTPNPQTLKPSNLQTFKPHSLSLKTRSKIHKTQTPQHPKLSNPQTLKHKA